MSTWSSRWRRGPSSSGREGRSTSRTRRPLQARSASATPTLVASSSRSSSSPSPPLSVNPSDGPTSDDDGAADGKIRWSAFCLMLETVGGGLSVVVLLLFALASVSSLAVPWWLSVWAAQYESTPADQVDVWRFLRVYCLLSSAALAVFPATSVVTIVGFVRAGRMLYHRLLAAILNAPLRWSAEAGRIGRILSMFSLNLRVLDGLYILTLGTVLETTATLLCRLVAITWIAPVVTVPSSLVAIILAFLVGRALIRTQLLMRRTMDHRRFALLGHVDSTLHGAFFLFLRTNRLTSWTERTTHERIDRLAQAALASVAVVRCVTLGLETLSALAVSGLALLVIRDGRLSSASTGFFLDSATTLAGLLVSQVLAASALVVQTNAVERIEEFLPPQIPQEPAPTEAGPPPPYWPTGGALVVDGLTVRHGPTVVLDRLSFSCARSEHLAVVGRTGSGKSSLLMALVRLVESDGRVLLDGIDTRTLNLGALRSAVALVQQDPLVLAGSVRSNLDPLGAYDDAELHGALAQSGLLLARPSFADLSAPIIDADLTQPDRQLLALARAFLRRPTLLLLDEATRSLPPSLAAHVDGALAALRQANGTTVVSVSHFVADAAACDRVLCVEDGQVREFGAPGALLADERSAFCALARSAGVDVEALREATACAEGSGA